MTTTIPLQFQKSMGSADYNIHVGSGLLNRLKEYLSLDEYSSVAIISDENVAPRWLDPLADSIDRKVHSVLISAGESEKHVHSAGLIWESLLENGFDRKSLIINLGGGVIGDLGGFVASTYMRGIDFVQIPTTLLSAVDASVGGKVGINHAGVKNSVGAFSQPKLVLIDVDTLSSLPARDLTAGYAEVLKHGLIYDLEYLNICRSKDISSLTREQLVDIISGSCRIKAAVVMEDEREGGLRKVLNFGHTIGHALESLSHEGTIRYLDGPLLHGEAVALGMVAEAHLSQLAGLLSPKEVMEVVDLVAGSGLPTSLEDAIDVSRVMKKITADKKNVAGEVRWTLLENIGKAVFDRRVSDEHVISALHALRAH